MIVARITEARSKGARLKPACKLAGIDVRTFQRWEGEGLQIGDRRPMAVRRTPDHALTQREREQILQVANEARFAEMPPARIVPMLADEGVYIASESSFSRVLRAHGQTRHRGRSKTPQRKRPPSTHIATGPRQLLCWDMTYLASKVLGQWFYLYLILDVYSRKIVGFEVHETDSSDHAVDLLRRTALSEGLHALSVKPVLHGDNGATLKATTVLAMMNWLGLRASYSRPRVSDDNAFIESLFRTAKYRPQYPSAGFASLQDARDWSRSFVTWYNHDHRHSGIRYVSPAERHAGQDLQILARRHELYQQAQAIHPRRWSRHTRNWQPIATVTLNPERDEVVNAALASENRTASAA
jgi:transposase InsO family protein